MKNVLIKYSVFIFKLLKYFNAAILTLKSIKYLFKNISVIYTLTFSQKMKC